MFSRVQSMSGIAYREVGNYRLLNQTKCKFQFSFLNDIRSKLPACWRAGEETAPLVGGEETAALGDGSIKQAGVEFAPATMVAGEETAPLKENFKFSPTPWVKDLFTIQKEMKEIIQIAEEMKKSSAALLRETRWIGYFIGPVQLQAVSRNVISRVIYGTFPHMKAPGTFQHMKAPRKSRGKKSLVKAALQPPGGMAGYVQSPSGRKKIEDFLNSRLEFEGSYNSVDAFVDAADRHFDDENASVHSFSDAQLDSMIDKARRSGFINEQSKQRPSMKFSIFVILNYENIKKYLF